MKIRKTTTKKQGISFVGIIRKIEKYDKDEFSGKDGKFMPVEPSLLVSAECTDGSEVKFKIANGDLEYYPLDAHVRVDVRRTAMDGYASVIASLNRFGKTREGKHWRKE